MSRKPYMEVLAERNKLRQKNKDLRAQVNLLKEQRDKAADGLEDAIGQIKELKQKVDDYKAVFENSDEETYIQRLSAVEHEKDTLAKANAALIDKLDAAKARNQDLDEQLANLANDQIAALNEAVYREKYEELRERINTLVTVGQGNMRSVLTYLSLIHDNFSQYRADS